MDRSHLDLANPARFMDVRLALLSLATSIKDAARVLQNLNLLHIIEAEFHFSTGFDINASQTIDRPDNGRVECTAVEHSGS
jgi:hypothetical protein